MPSGGEHAGAEPRRRRPRSPGDARRDRLARQHVGVDRRRAERGESLRGSSDFPVAIPPVSATRSTHRLRRLRLRAFVARLRRGLGGGERVLQQHRDRQRSDAAGHRRQRAGDLGDATGARRRRRPSRAWRTSRAAASRRRRSSRPAPRSLHRRRPDVDDRRARLDEVARHERRAGRSPRRGCRPARRPPADPASSSGRSSPSRRAAAAASPSACRRSRCGR